MRRFRDFPISIRLTGMNMLVSGVALLLACGSFFAYDIVSFREAIVRSLRTQAQIISANSLSSLVFNDPHTAEQTLAALKTSTHIMSAEIYTPDGKPFAGYWRDGASHNLPQAKLPKGMQENYSFQGREVDLVRTIVLQGNVIGFVSIRADLQTLTARLRSYAFIVITVLLISMLAALGISALSQKAISEPVMELANAAYIVSKDKNYAVRAPAPQNQNEIATLVEAFNQMLTQIQQRDDELQQAHDQLEARVKQRTAELQLAEEKLRVLSNRLLQLRDEERRQIARELHDSTGQNLAALSINLSMVQNEASKWGPRAGKAMEDSIHIVKNVLQEVRTISYLLHPPLLDDAGLGSALRWLVDGFVARSHIAVTLEIPQDCGRLSRDLETALFRVVQECLTNVHRHSGSSSASIRITRESDFIRLEVQDAGKGMVPESMLKAKLGVGIAGMQERMRQLGGRLEIHSGSHGTTVVAIAPLYAGAAAQGQTGT